MKGYRIIFYFHLILSLAYCTFIIRDIFSAIAFLLGILNLIGLFSLNKRLLFAHLAIYTVDLVIKITNPNLLNLSQIDQQSQQNWYSLDYLNADLVQNIIKTRIGVPEIIYCGIHVSLWAAISNYFTQIAWKWGPLFHQISYYTTPILIFILSYICQDYYIRSAYLASFLALTVIADRKGYGIFISRIVIALIVMFKYATESLQLYKKSNGQTIHLYDGVELNYEIKVLLQFCLLMSFQAHQTPNLYDVQLQNARVVSESRRLKRKQTSVEQAIFYRVILEYTVTFILAILTTGLGNILIAIAFYRNLPIHNGEKFRAHILLGVIVSILAQPRLQTIFYAGYLLFARDYQPQNIILQKYSSRIIVELSRLYIFLNHVSVINFLIGIFRKPFMLVLAICFKIVCRHFGQVSILMGTNQSYGLNFFTFGSLDDTFLWIYLVLLCMYSAQAMPTFSDSNILNIFEQYSFLRNPTLQKMLHILKVFHWIAYTFIALIILNSYPSLFILVRAIILFGIIGTDIVRSSQRKTKNRILITLWNINLYVTIIIGFVRYFYMLKIYINQIEAYQDQKHPDTLSVDLVSPLLYQILMILSNNAKILGLNQLTVTASEINIWTMLRMFFSDIMVVLISLVMIFIMEVKVCQDYRDIIKKDQNQQYRSADYFHQIQESKIAKQNNQDQDRNNQSKRQIKNKQRQESINQKISSEKIISKKSLDQKPNSSSHVGYRIQYKKYTIHYLYRRYIKPIHMSFQSDSLPTIITSTFLMEIIFVLFSIIYFKFQQQELTSIIEYFPMFIAYAFYFYKTNYFVESLQISSENSATNGFFQQSNQNILSSPQSSRPKIYFPQKIKQQAGSTQKRKKKNISGTPQNESVINSCVQQDQDEKDYPNYQFHQLRFKVILFMVCYSCLIIIFVYVKYVWSYVNIDQGTKIQYKLYEVITKFAILIFLLIFYEFEGSCPYDQLSKHNKGLFLPSKQSLSLFRHNYQQVTQHVLNILEILILSFWVHSFFNGHFLSLCCKIIIVGFWIAKQLKKIKQVNAKNDPFQRMKWLVVLLINSLFDASLYDGINLMLLLIGRVYCYWCQTYYIAYLQKDESTKKVIWLSQIRQDPQQQSDKQQLKQDQHQEINYSSLQRKPRKPQWFHLKSYRTIAYVSPLLVAVLLILATTYLKYSLNSAVLSFLQFLILGLLIIAFIMPKFRRKIHDSITKKLLIVLLSYGVIYYIGLLCYGYYLWNVTKNQIYRDLELQILPNGDGLSIFIFSHLLLLYILYNQQLTSRSIQAYKYWQIKSKILVQIGAQLHNQKKLVALEIYYKERQSLQKKRDKLIEQIKTNKQYLKMKYQTTIHKKNLIDSLSVGNLLNEQKINGKYELFSNMLILFDCEVLTHCFQKLNLYDRFQKFTVRINTNDPEIEYNGRSSIISTPQKIDIELFNDKQLIKAHQVVKRANQIRKSILQNYQRSIAAALNKWEIENVDQEMLAFYQERDSASRVSKQMERNSELKFDDLYASPRQKLQETYNECYELIHKKSMQYAFIIRKIVQNSEMICLMIVAGWNFFGGIYTMPINIIIFAWAIVLQSKTSVWFWISLLCYASFICTTKILLGCDFELIQGIKQSDVVKLLFLKNKDSCTYEFILIVVSTVQIILINLSGTSFKTFSERETIYDSFYRMHLNRYCVTDQLNKKNKVQQEYNQSSIGQQQFINIYKNLSRPAKQHFFDRVFSKSRFKPGKDLYPLTALIQLLILLYIFFFYDQMEYQSKSNQRTLGELLKVDKFSANMVIAMFIQIIIIIIDRFIVSLNFINQQTQKLQNFVMQVTFRHDNHIFVDQVQPNRQTKLKHQPPDNTDTAGNYDFLLIVKYLFHLFLLFFVSFLVYLYIPSSGLKKSIIPSHCKFSQNSKASQTQVCEDNSYFYLTFFYFLYLLYFLISGLQIKHGFNRNKCRNTLMESYYWVNYYMYLCFTGLPFLWQFKKICDWTVTATALPLFHWMKFEDINARLYQSKCEGQMLENKPAGTVWYKYLVGPVGFLSILALVFSPVMIYSQINPFAVRDQILGSAFQIDLIQDNNIQYKFFSTSFVKSIGHADKQLGIFENATEDNNPNKILADKEMFRIDMAPYPDQNFLLSQPAVKKLSKRLNQTYNSMQNKSKFNAPKHQFYLRLNVIIIQKQGGERTLKWTKSQLTAAQIQDFHLLLQNSKSSIIIDKYFSPFPGLLSQRNLIISTPNNCQYFEARIFNQKTQNISNIFYFYATSTKFQIGFGVVTFYLTYVLLVSRLLRFYLTGNTQNIIYEGWHMQKILVLCDAVRSARILQDFYGEQYFYFELIDLMRAPKQLISISGDFQQLINQKRQKIKFA